MPISRLVNAQAESLEPEDEQVEVSLRPQNFNQVIGRDKEKKTLAMMISSATKKDEPLDHLLFHGPPGLGKTSLAHVAAVEMGVSLTITSGPAIIRQGDLAALFTSLPKRGILFIDEIHRLNKTIEEVMYPAMEDRALDLVVGKGAGARTMRIDLEPFTIIGATTRVGLLSKPLLDRFGADFRLDYYSDSEMVEIVQQKARLLGAQIDSEAARILATTARRTPRIAVKILKRVRDNAISQDLESITPQLVTQTLDLLGIDPVGLDYLDRKILHTLITAFGGRPVGLSSLAASLSEEVDTLADVYEPFLMQEGYIQRTPRGRVPTAKAYKHLGLEYNNES
jgi:Holliday junction DNA helicase RuvB